MPLVRRRKLYVRPGRESNVTTYKCDGCGAMVGVTDGKYDEHMAGETRCDRSGYECKMDSVRVRRFEHYDFQLAKPQQTREGFWRVEGRVARTGVQHYTDGSGTKRGEYRSDSEVRKSLPGFTRAPLTNNHPPAMVTPENAKKYVEGAVGEARLGPDGWVTAPITLYTADAIAAMKAGRVQLSVGYTCEVVDESGEHEGTPYSHSQRNISVNHLALVDRARAGEDARIRLDAGDAFALGQLNQPLVTSKQVKVHMLKIDDMTFEVADANVQAAVDRAIAAARKDGESEKLRADNADKLRAETQKALDVLQAKHDALEAAAKQDAAEVLKLDGAEISMADFRDAGKRETFLAGVIEKAADKRASLIVEARKFLGEKEKLDGKTEIEIQKLVIAKADKDLKLDGKSADYVQARYDGVIEAAAKNKTSAVDRARQVATTVHVDNSPSSNPADARQAMVARMLASNVKVVK